MQDDFVIMGFHFHIARLESNFEGKKTAVCPKWLMVLSKQSVQHKEDFFCNLTVDL